MFQQKQIVIHLPSHEFYNVYYSLCYIDIRPITYFARDTFPYDCKIRKIYVSLQKKHIIIYNFVLRVMST